MPLVTRQFTDLIAFARPSQGTYFDSARVLRTAEAGVPRFDHDPVTGAPLGLLIEPQRTNLLLHSNAFDNAAWAKFNCSVTPNAALAPDGTTSVYSLIPNTTIGKHSVGFTVAPGSNFVFSVYVKTLGVSHVALNESAQSGSFSRILDLATGSLAAGGDGTTVVQSLGGGVYRLSWAHSINTALHSMQIVALNASGVNPHSYKWAGDGVSGLLIWQADLTTGTTLSTPIPTTSAQVTRAADTASISGAAFSNWFRPDEGTLFIDVTPAALGANGITLSDGTANNVMRLAPVSATEQASVTTGGVLQAALDAGTPVAGQSVRLALAYSPAGFALSLNGGAPVTAAGLIPSVNRLDFIGQMTVRRATFYPRRLTNGELQALTA